MKRCLRCWTEFHGEDWNCPSCDFVPENIRGIPLFAPELAESGETFPQSSFARLSELEAGNFWFCARNRIIADAFLQICKVSGNLMEVGCGTGFVLAGLKGVAPEMDARGSELSTTALRFAAKRLPDTAFIQMDAREIPYTEEFDTIAVFDVLEHIEQDTRVLGEIRRALKPDGILLITVPQHPFLWSYMDEYSHHVRRYTFGDLASKLDATGLRIEQRTSFVSFLLPLMWMGRKFGRPQEANSDGMAELQLGKFTNLVLEGFLEIERRLIRWGVRFPFGGSLFVVARRVSPENSDVTNTPV
jgi:SAM-dependent methyltransferase